jgi:hypothetical protein
MKIRHVEQITRGLRPRTDTERSTKNLLAVDLGRLRWCLWHNNVSKLDKTLHQILLMCRSSCWKPQELLDLQVNAVRFCCFEGSQLLGGMNTPVFFTLPQVGGTRGQYYHCDGVAGVAWQLKSWLADLSSGRFLPPSIIHPLRPWKAKSEQHQQNCQVDEGFAGIGLDQPEIVDHA